MKKIITYTEDQVAQIGALLNGIVSTGVQSAKSIAVIAQILDSGTPGEIKNMEQSEKLSGLYSSADWANMPDQKTKISNKPEKKEGEG